MTQPLAMQKVEGSNPFSRFEESPAPAGLSASRSRAGRVGTDPVGGSVPACARYRPHGRLARSLRTAVRPHFQAAKPMCPRIRCGFPPMRFESLQPLFEARSCECLELSLFWSSATVGGRGGLAAQLGPIRLRTILAATVALLAVSRPAGAVTIGSDLSANAIIGGPSGCPCTFVPTESHAVVVPEAGVLTTWRFKSESSFDLKGEVFRLVVLKGNTAVAMDSQVMPSKPNSSRTSTNSKRPSPSVPGERLGLEAKGDVFTATLDPSVYQDQWVPPLKLNETLPPTYPNGKFKKELLFNADIGSPSPPPGGGGSAQTGQVKLLNGGPNPTILTTHSVGSPIRPNANSLRARPSPAAARSSSIRSNPTSSRPAPAAARPRGREEEERPRQGQLQHRAGANQECEGQAEAEGRRRAEGGGEAEGLPDTTTTSPTAPSHRSPSGSRSS